MAASSASALSAFAPCPLSKSKFIAMRALKATDEVSAKGSGFSVRIRLRWPASK